MKMMIRSHLQFVIAFALSLLHTGISFFTDRLIFETSPGANPFDYTICKILAFLAFFAFYAALCGLIMKKADRLKKILLFALPYLIVMIAVACLKLPQGYLSNDETLIVSSALHLEHYTWFYYLTTYYYIVCFMLIPVYLAPIFIKLLIEYLVIGSVIARIDEAFGKPYRYFGYLLFLLYPVIAYTTSAHRLPIYFLLYLLLFSTLLFDGISHAPLSLFKEICLLCLCAVLTQWRTEGIYLLILTPILMLFVYPSLRKKKALIVLLLLLGMIQYVVSIPQNGLVAKEMGAAADDRMKPFYAYTITNMLRNGLDSEKNAQDLAIVDRYLSLEKIDAINDYYGDINYEDVLILYQDGFVGVREEAGIAEFFDYANALKRIFANNIPVFLKTRIGAFCYAAVPYRIETGNGIGSFFVSIVKFFSYNLFLPFAIIVLLALYSLIRKRFYSLFVMLGVLAHWFLVFILAPASYFKYYFPVYIMAYFYLLLLILEAFFNKKQDQKIQVLF